MNHIKGGVKMFQQGDVILIKVSEVKGEKLNHLTLAKGEHTGNHHIITEGDVTLYDHEGTLFLRVESENATLTHQEHKKVILPKGEYKIGIVREYDHFAEESKRVQD